MRIVPLDQIEVRDRQRTKIDAGPLNELREGILSVGNLHPPVCWFDETTKTWVLSVGERRLTAIKAIAKDGLTYYANNEPVPPGHCGILTLWDALTESGRLEAEIFENIQRVDFDWKDRCKALSDLHKLRISQNPDQSTRETGRELVEQQAFGNPVAAANAISDASLVAKHLANPKVAGARNIKEAKQMILKQQEEALHAAIARKLIKEKGVLNVEVSHGDLLEILPTLEEATVDLILADPPYGINAGGGGFRARTMHHHDYEDDPKLAMELAQSILSEGFRICKPRANIFLFCDIRNFTTLQLVAANLGWTVFPRPLIWGKSDSEGLAPWGGGGPRITTEFIFYATKGQRRLHSSPIDYLRFNRVAKDERVHAAEKPVDLLKHLIQCATLAGDCVLDPCCGSGSTLVAAHQLGRSVIGIEKDADYYNTALANVGALSNVGSGSVEE